MAQKPIPALKREGPFLSKSPSLNSQALNSFESFFFILPSSSISTIVASMLTYAQNWSSIVGLTEIVVSFAAQRCQLPP
jgi:hypothetical protein